MGVKGQRRDAQGLTGKQALFVIEFLKDRHATKAYVRAGYAPANADTQAGVLMRVPAVAQAIADATHEVMERAQVSAARVLQELARVALSDPRSLFDESGRLKPVTEWTAEDSACIAGMDIRQSQFPNPVTGVPDLLYKVKLWDKPKTLELLAKHYGMLTDKVEISGDAALIERLATARKRKLIAAVAIQEE
jgi:phage terminase small subunit